MDDSWVRNAQVALAARDESPKYVAPVGEWATVFHYTVTGAQSRCKICSKCVGAALAVPGARGSDLTGPYLRPNAPPDRKPAGC